MKKLSFLIIVSFAFLASCNKSKDPAIPKCFLASVKSSDYSIYYINFTWGATHEVAYVKSGDSTTTTVGYDNQGRIGIFDTTEFFYENNRLMYLRAYPHPGLAENQIDFEYNDHGQVVKKTFYDNNNGISLDLYTYYTYTYANSTTTNPLTQSQYLPNDVLQETITYEYDNKLTPYAYSVDFLSFWSGMHFNKNNITKTTSSAGGSEAVTTYTYTYNEKGYPLTVTRHQGSSVDTITYTYDN